mmetsp:Transcript_104610/g.156691  ORF Transcript_104610/g.156691 Transcript_104610/m.156691 type:complete len:548 (+) Transcript_104610:167-1810(+)|eukprot:CAMPEP_0117006560 /NCGR_PEP_ID=MMETSP0472-20121206/6746_1 /TAXON_ID=693140 ORGANISM="Tiarina fusus, Strain LIS" /NCGR_SAMPLE_ID=MMETSP0472 /ASSEMBLY_ACC=CAM_ASM_000603 /LENGTH=547 /DNA_ID=CAMNT_0004708063 /DNA_START=156 /DNA_END=1799 /DNA_ORIENTATION=+
METAYMGMGVEVDKGENARLSSLIGAMAVADLVKTTLGPKGMDKILQNVDPNDQSISVTNDGATILGRLALDNPAAKVLVDMSKVQDSQVGDGTTSVAVLCGELLRQAEELLLQQRIHPQTICQGYRRAGQVARSCLETECAVSSVTREDLLKIARTTLSSKLVHAEKEHFANLCLQAVERLKSVGDIGEGLNLDHVQILQLPGGSLRDSYLEEGFLLEKTIGIGQPKRQTNCNILLANTSMDTDKIKIYGSRVQVESLNDVASIESAEKRKMKGKVDKILAHPGVNVFINRQLIYNYPESLMKAGGCMTIEHADFDGMERLAAVTGGDIVSTFDTPENVTLGKCDVIEEVLIGETKVIRFGGCKSGAACTIVLRGSSTHILQEAERSLHDALCILVATIQNPRRIYGGGCTEVRMARAVEALAVKTPGKQALAMQAFAKALLQLPMIIADNGGFDAADLVTKLRAAHAKGDEEMKEDSSSSSNERNYPDFGLDMEHGKIASMDDLGIMESFTSKMQVVTSAAEAAEMILRVDDIIKCAPRRREEMF